MSEPNEVADGVTIDDVLELQQQDSSPLWEKARAILTAYPKCLAAARDEGGTKYLVSPSASYPMRGKDVKWSVAVMMNGDQLMDAQFLLINGKLKNMIEIPLSGEDVPHIYPDGAKFLEDISPVLDQLVAVVKQRQADDKARYERARKQIIDHWHRTRTAMGNWWWRNSATVWGTLGIIALLVCMVGFFGSIIYFGNKEQYSQQYQIATFDQKHPGLVIKGEAFDIKNHPKGTITSHSPDSTLGIPQQPSEQVDQYPRAYQVDPGTCSASDPRNWGRIAGNQKLLVESDAPDGIIQTEVLADGTVHVCATDPTGKGSSEPWTVYMQTQTVN